MRTFHQHAHCWLVGKVSAMIRSIYLALAALAAVAILGQAPGALALENQRFICTYGEGVEARFIDVVYETGEPLPCRTEYIKAGSRQILGRAQKTPGHCDRLAEKLIAKLAGFGFECRAESSAALAVAPVAALVVDEQQVDEQQVDAPRVTERAAAGSSSDSPAAAPPQMPAPNVLPVVAKAKAEAMPVPRVLNYLAALQADAQAGQTWAVNELAVIDGIGMDVFYERWETQLFASIDANHDGQMEWFVGSADCVGDDCPGYVLERSASRDATGNFALSLLMSADTRALVVLNCGVPRGQWRPLLAQGGDGVRYSYRVFETSAGLYQQRYQCVEERASDDSATMRWSVSGAAGTQVARGKPGLCKQHLQARYPNCYIPEAR